MAQARILSLGGIHIDFQVRVARPPEEGEVLRGSDFHVASAGRAARVALLARARGAPAQLLARVGEDEWGLRALVPLREAGVDVRHVRAVPGEVTGVALVSVRPGGPRSVVLAPNANEAWGLEGPREASEVVRAAPDGSVLVADLEVPLPVVASAVEMARGRGLRVVLRPTPAERMPEALCRCVDMLAASPSEAGELCGLDVESPDDAAEAGRRLRQRGVGTACVRLPDGGCVVVDAQGPQHLAPPPRAHAPDDSFTAALAVGLLQGLAPPEAARRALGA